MNEATVLSRPVGARFAAYTVDLTWIAACVLAGTLLGLCAGAVARVAMRAVALLVGLEPSFTVAGTLGIMILGLFAGAGGGLLFIALHRPLARLRQWGGLIFGAALTALLIVPLFGIGQEEAPGVSPLAIPALFAWIPLLYGVLMAPAALRLRGRLARGGARRAPLAFVVAAAALLVLAFMSMVGALSGSPRLSPITAHYFGAASVDFGAMTEFLRLLGFLFTILYCALTAVAFYTGGTIAAGRRAVLLLPLVPALLLAQSGLAWPFSSVLPESRWMLAALRAGGLTALIALLLTFPAMPLGVRRTAAVLAAFLFAAFALLAAGPVSGKGWTEWLLWSMLALACGSAIFLQAATLHRTQANRRRGTVICLACFATAAALFVAIFGAALLSSAWGFRNASAFAAATGVVMYWLPWLLLPAGMLAARGVA